MKQHKNNRNELKLDQLEEGCNKTLENADALIEESKILLKNKRWARAYFLTSIAIEELGKYIIIKSAQARVIYGNQEWTRFWKRLKNHKAKKGMFLHIEYFFSKVPASKYLYKLDKEESIEEIVKMASLYTDFYETGFLKPMDVISKELAINAVELAEKRLKNVKWHQEITKGIGMELKKEDIEKWYELTGLKKLVNIEVANCK